MVCGHSYMPCDRVFGWIEKKINKEPKICRSVEYVSIIRSARKGKVHTIQMGQADFFDIKTLKEMITLRKLQRPLLFSKGRTFTMTRNKPWFYHIDSDNGSDNVDLEKKNVKGPSERVKNKTVPKYVPSPLLPEQLETPYMNKIVQLDATKIRHLGELKEFLSEEGRSWVAKVINEQTTEGFIEDSIDEEEVDDDIENRADDYITVFGQIPQPQ